MAFYLNAKSVALTYDGHGEAMAYSAGAGAIGNFGNEIQYFLGQLALLTIHSRILLPSEILRLYTDPWACTGCGEGCTERRWHHPAIVADAFS